MFADETGHVVGGFERNVTDAERGDAEVVAMDHAGLAGIAFKDALVDEAFGVWALGGAVGVG